MWGWIAFAIMFLLYMNSLRRLTKESESLTEYIEFLLMNRLVYQDHRQKYRELLKSIGARVTDPLQLAMSGKRSIRDLAAEMAASIFLSNVLQRSDTSQWQD